MSYEKAVNITEASKRIEIDVKPKNWFHKVLMKCMVVKSTYVFDITSPTLSTRLKFNSITEGIDWKNLIESNVDSLSLENKVKQQLLTAVATLIHNKMGNPSKNLVDSLESLTESELNAVAQIIFSMMDVGFFLSFLIYMRKMELPVMTINSISGNGEDQ